MHTDNYTTKRDVQASFIRTWRKLEGNGSNRPTLYLSGPITGIKDYDHPEFKNKAEHFRNLNYFVINPTENFDGNTDRPYEQYFLEDFIQLLFCTHIYMMEGWKSSRGAYSEYLVARKLGLIFVDESGLFTSPPYAPETAESNEYFQQDGLLSAIDLSGIKDAAAKLDDKIQGESYPEFLGKRSLEQSTQEMGSKGLIDLKEGFISELKHRLINRHINFEEAYFNEAWLRYKINLELDIKSVEGNRNEELKSLTEQSFDLVNKVRAKEYGHPSNDFARNTGMLKSLGYCFKKPDGTIRELEPYDFPIIMSCVKLSRLINNITTNYFHKDSLKDLVGYAHTLEMLYDKP